MKKACLKHKWPLFFLFSYIIFVPVINYFLKILEKCFKVNLNTIDINIFNLFTVIFRNFTIFITWIVINIVIVLVYKNIITTKKNAKIEIEGINLKKKDGTFGTADWASEDEIKEFLSIRKKRRNNTSVKQKTKR